jgi:hypothetical protein
LLHCAASLILTLIFIAAKLLFFIDFAAFFLKESHLFGDAWLALVFLVGFQSLVLLGCIWLGWVSGRNKVSRWLCDV